MSAAKFLDYLAGTGLLDEGILSKLHQKVAKSKKNVSIEVVVKALMDQGHLTRFQATKLVTEYGDLLKSEAKTDPSLEKSQGKKEPKRKKEDELGFAADESLDESLLTWNVVWWYTDWVYGDTINFQYDLSISPQDVYQFTPADISDVDIEKLVPDHYALAQNYPNPFNPITQIKYSIAKGGAVELVVYDVLGREVRRLINTKLQAGKHIAAWDGKNHFGEHVGTGMYFYRLKAGNFLKTRKMILLK